MFAFLLPLLSSLPGLLGKYFTEKNNLEQARIETQRQIEVAKQNMAAEIAKGQMELNQTIVQATGSWFKYFTFIMWFGPFVIGVIAPAYSKEIFNNLNTMPEWYVQSCMLIMFTVWGISVSASTVGNIFSGLGTFMASRREYKLEKAKIDRKAFYAAIKSLKGVVTQADVNSMEPVFDEIDNKE